MYDQASDVEQICYQLRLSEWPRALNRARINSLFNGQPPYTEEEAQTNNVTINVNDLSSTTLAHDARAQFYQAFLKPGRYFSCTTDFGPKHKRQKFNQTVTNNLSKIMKRSLPYWEKHRATFCQDVLHGIGPGNWDERDSWCPSEIGVEDVLVPSRTLLTMKNLPLIVFPRSYTAIELKKMTMGAKRDPAWNMDLVDRCLEWIDKETTRLAGAQFSEYWSPEKVQERIKGDGTTYASDQCPTVDTFDFYYWDDSGKTQGWRRRIILDAWGEPQATGSGYSMSDRGDYVTGTKGQFLYNPGERKYADKWTEFVSFQFADLSAVAPFQYHSIRSLGFLLYAVCHLQNRLRCKFNESVFEALMMYFKVGSMDDAQRALKLSLANRGFIDDTIKPLPAAERWQVNANLVELGLRENSSVIQSNSSSYLQSKNFSQDRVEKTKFQVMAEVNATTAMVSAALLQAYRYQESEYSEIFRRFCRRNSRDPDVREFRLKCLKQGVPEEALDPSYWELASEQVMGAGNKTMEMAISEQLMQFRPLYDASSQRKILRNVTLAITDDPAIADDLVPEQPEISDSVHDSELAFGTLMQSSPVSPKAGLNAVEVVATILKLMAGKVQAIMQSGGMGTPQDLQGLQMSAQYAGTFLQQLAGDETNKSTVRQFGKAMGELMNEVKGMAQRQQQAAQTAAEQQQQQNGGLDPKDSAKIQATMLMGQTKAQIATKSAAQRSAQKKLQWEQKMQMDAQQHSMDLKKEAQQHALETRQSMREHKANIIKTDLEAASNIKRNRLKSVEE